MPNLVLNTITIQRSEFDCENEFYEYKEKTL